MTMIGFGQVIKITCYKEQSFNHSIDFNTNYAAENNLINYTQASYVDFDLIFDLDNKEVTLVNRMLSTFEQKYKIIQINRSANLIDLITDDNGTNTLIVLGTHKTDGKKVLIMESFENNQIEGSFYPEPVVTIVKHQE